MPKKLFNSDTNLEGAELRSIQEIIDYSTQYQEAAAKSIGLKVNANKTKILRVNANNQQPIQIYQEDIEDVQEFTYLGSKMTVNGDVEAEIKVRIRKARHVLAFLGRLGNQGKSTPKPS